MFYLIVSTERWSVIFILTFLSISKINRIVSKALHQSNEKLVLQIQFPFAWSIVWNFPKFSWPDNRNLVLKCIQKTRMKKINNHFSRVWIIFSPYRYMGVTTTIGRRFYQYSRVRQGVELILKNPLTSYWFSC